MSAVPSVAPRGPNRAIRTVNPIRINGFTVIIVSNPAKTTFQAPVPRVIAARIASTIILHNIRNSSEFLFRATNALLKELGEKPIDKSEMAGFIPYKS